MSREKGIPTMTTSDNPGDEQRQSLWGALHDSLDQAPLWSRGNWRLAVAAVVAVTVIVGVTGLLVSAAGSVLGAGSDVLSGWLTDNRTAASITNPLRAWLDAAHAGGVPATGGELWLLWIHTTAALWLAAVCGSVYARIGWALIGALSTAAVYAGSPAAAADVTAATTATTWLLLSLPAYNRAAARAAARRHAPTRPGGDGDA